MPVGGKADDNGQIKVEWLVGERRRMKQEKGRGFEGFLGKGKNEISM